MVLKPEGEWENKMYTECKSGMCGEKQTETLLMWPPHWESAKEQTSVWENATRGEGFEQATRECLDRD